MFWSSSLCKAAAARQYARYSTGNSPKRPSPRACSRTSRSRSCMPWPRTSSFRPPGCTPGLAGSPPEGTRLVPARSCGDGRAVAQRLELPDLFVDAVAFHHSPDNLREMITKDAAGRRPFIVASLFPHTLDAWNHDDAAATAAVSGRQTRYARRRTRPSSTRSSRTSTISMATSSRAVPRDAAERTARTGDSRGG